MRLLEVGARGGRGRGRVVEGGADGAEEYTRVGVAIIVPSYIAAMVSADSRSCTWQ